MNGDKALTESLCVGIASRSNRLRNIDIVLCPPFPFLYLADACLKKSTVSLGAQDLDANTNGPFTGQVSASMLNGHNCKYVIVGHSERRVNNAETDQLVSRKTQIALEHHLIPILCIGETTEQRKAGQTEQTVIHQLQNVIDHTGIGAFNDIVIAYEPIWAIGTNITATPDQAQEIHSLIREQLRQQDKKIANDCRIIYGGSMKPENARELIAQTDIDGGLVGGASLNSDDFFLICQAALSD